MTWFSRRDIWVIPGIYVSFGLLLFLFQDRLIYLPDTTPVEDCLTPGSLVATEEDMRGYYIPTPEATGIVVVYHGNAGRACNRHFYTQPIHEASYSLLLVEYPGYGETTRRPNTEKLLQHTYVVAEYLDTLPYESVKLIGESIGSGFASYHATHQDIDHLILISPLDTLSRRTQRAVPFYPTRWLLRTELRVSEWSTYAPHTTVLIAEHDDIIPVSHSHAVYQALPEDLRTLITIEGANHNNLYGHHDFLDTIRTILLNKKAN